MELLVQQARANKQNTMKFNFYIKPHDLDQGYEMNLVSKGGGIFYTLGGQSDKAIGRNKRGDGWTLDLNKSQPDPDGFYAISFREMPDSITFSYQKKSNMIGMGAGIKQKCKIVLERASRERLEQSPFFLTKKRCGIEDKKQVSYYAKTVFTGVQP